MPTKYEKWQKQDRKRQREEKIYKRMLSEAIEHAWKVSKDREENDSNRYLFCFHYLCSAARIDSHDLERFDNEAEAEKQLAAMIEAEGGDNADR